jgi:hypothetical protein
MRTMVGTLVVAALFGFGCKKQDDSGKPSGVPPLDPSTQAAAPAPAPAAAPAPGPAPAAPPAPAAAPGGTITGKIVVPAAMASRKPSGTLYLVARRPPDNPSARGTLIAVKKMPATTFPLTFELSAADMPFQNGPFDGDLQLTARIDQDGDPMSRQKGDIFGVLPKVPVGSHDVKISLDQLQKETESLAGGGMPHGGPPGMPPGHP